VEQNVPKAAGRLPIDFATGSSQAWNRIQDHQTLHQLGVIVSQIKTDDRTPIVACQANLAEPKRTHEGVNICSESALVVTGHWTVRAAQTAKVWCDYSEVLSYRWENFAPRVPALWPSVQKYDWITLAGDYVMHAKAVYDRDMMSPRIGHQKTPP
jgi:hypothetical protein